MRFGAATAWERRRRAASYELGSFVSVCEVPFNRWDQAVRVCVTQLRIDPFPVVLSSFTFLDRAIAAYSPADARPFAVCRDDTVGGADCAKRGYRR